MSEEMRGPGKSDDWYCPKCDLGFGDQDCDAMVDNETVACPRCGGGLVDAGKVEVKSSDGSIPKDSEWGKLIGELMEMKTKFDEEHGDLKTSPRLRFPIEVSWIIVSGLSEPTNPKVGRLVRIRPVNDKKTYLGLYLGELIRDVLAAQGEKSKALLISAHRNPAVFVFDLERIVWGSGSWWSFVENEEQLKEVITDADIQGTWYVKAFQELMKQKPSDKESDVEFIARKKAELKAKGLGGGEKPGNFIVELEPEVFLDSDAEGDPGRTLDRERAGVYSSYEQAVEALERARIHRPFEGAKVIEKESVDE